MGNWFRQLDNLLRGDATLMESLRQGRFDVPVGGLGAVAVLLAAVAGACVGSFGLLHPEGYGIVQVFASALKMPMLFFFTLLFTFPSLYVFNALVGSRLTATDVLRLLVAMLAVMLAVLASLGPIVVFFSLSSESYHFIQLLNVVACAVAGFLGLAFLLRTLHRLVIAQEWRATPLPPPPAAPALPHAPSVVQVHEAGDALPDVFAADEPVPPATTIEVERRGALELVGDRTDRRARLVFQIWVIVFALVGAQMSWVLRPFLGHPGGEFAWLRPRGGNFFEAVMRAIGHVLGG